MGTARSNENDTKIRAEESESLLIKKPASSIVLSETFNFGDHAKNAFQAIESYFNDQWLTDFTLVTGNKRINVHRLVLSVSSPYFATMFKSFLKESSQDEIKMKEINEDALLALVQYCYTGSIELREDNVEILFVTARLLQMDPVVEACSQFLIKQLDSCNCLGIRKLADAHGCDSLLSAAHAYALKYFVQVVQNEEFLLLSADKVAEFLRSDDVNVPSEETIFNALTTWLKHDSINRIKDASKLLSYVKLPLLMPEFIVDHIQGNELFNDQQTIQDLILEAFTYHLLRKPTDSLLKSGRTRPRKSTVDILLALGQTDKEKLFVVGGGVNGISTCIVESFDFSHQLWETWPLMKRCRNSFGVAVLNEFLYAVGGSDDTTDLKTVERCDLTSKKWSFVASMSTKRCDAGVAVLNNKLYVVGGCIGKHDLNTMECYDPKTNTWTPCSPMSEARRGVGIGVLHGYIYIVGGFGNVKYLNSVERYDPKTDQWTTIAPMSIGRSYAGVGVLGDGLFVVGGSSNAQRLSLVEAYDPVHNEWQKLAPMERTMAGVFVAVKGLSKYWIDFFSRLPL